MSPASTEIDNGLEAQLRSLDAATTPLDLAPGSDPAAVRLLAQVLDEARIDTPAADDAGFARRAQARTARRVALLAGAAAVGAGALTLLPALDADNATPAWAAVPSAAPAGAADDLAGRCAGDVRKALSSRPSNASPPGSITPSDLDSAKPMLSEARGSSLLVVLTTDGDFPVACTRFAGSESQWTATFPIHEPEPTRAALTASAETSASDGYVAVMGRVGSRVRALQLSTAEGKVVATVENGWMAAWWPSAHDPANGDPFERIRVSVTLDDGSIRDLGSLNDVPTPVPSTTG